MPDRLKTATVSLFIWIDKYVLSLTEVIQKRNHIHSGGEGWKSIINLNIYAILDFAKRITY